LVGGDCCHCHHRDAGYCVVVESTDLADMSDIDAVAEALKKTRKPYDWDSPFDHAVAKVLADEVERLRIKINYLKHLGETFVLQTSRAVNEYQASVNAMGEVFNDDFDYDEGWIPGFAVIKESKE